MTRVSVDQVVHDCSRPAAKGVGVVVNVNPAGELRVCYWRGGQQHWSAPQSRDVKQIEPIADWTFLPLTLAKRLAAAAFERRYLVHVMASAKGAIVDASRAAGVDRSNFRRLLQRHGLAKPTKPTKTSKRPVRSKANPAGKTAKKTKKTTKAKKATKTTKKKQRRRPNK